MLPLFGLCGAFKETPAKRELLEDISEALGDWSDKETVGALDVPKSKLSEMRALLAAGPGVLRFGDLPARFWLRFLVARGRRFGLMVLEDVRVQPDASAAGEPDIERRRIRIEAVELRPRMVKSELRQNEAREEAM